MQLVRRYRIPALFCALAVLVCELISRPYANMGISDDGPYILVTQHLAATGHIVYNGWSAAMLIWQLYLGAALIKLFGFSFTTVRMSTLLVSLGLAFLLQRTLVRAGITERNATIGTLALVLSPLYLMLSVTFMSDIHGLFAIVLCLYGCLRALQSPATRAAILWLCFAVATNALCGTSRQLAWLGILVMVPSTLWLLRAQRRVLLAGAAATLAGVLFILCCLLWLKHQPYTTPETFHISNVSVAFLLGQFSRFFLELPFLLVPIALLFLPQLRKSSPRALAIFSAAALGFAFIAVHLKRIPYLEPILWAPPGCNWIVIYGEYASLSHGTPDIFLQAWARLLLSIVAYGGLIGLILSFFRSEQKPRANAVQRGVTWQQLGVLCAPFTVAYIVLLIFRAAAAANDDGTGTLFDRYALGLLLVALLCLVRYYQDRIQPRLPLSCAVLIAVMAVYGVLVTHNTFALYRARVAIADELRAAGVPDTSVDNGWEYNINVEVQHAHYINNPGMVLPDHAYVRTAPLPAGTCSMTYHDETPLVDPLYGISFDPNACYGPAPFAPVHYSRWLAASPGTLYVIKYTALAKP
jgi:hypothetical protein